MDLLLGRSKDKSLIENATAMWCHNSERERDLHIFNIIRKTISSSN